MKKYNNASLSWRAYVLAVILFCLDLVLFHSLTTVWTSIFWISIVLVVIGIGFSFKSIAKKESHPSGGFLMVVGIILVLILLFTLQSSYSLFG